MLLLNDKSDPTNSEHSVYSLRYTSTQSKNPILSSNSKGHFSRIQDNRSQKSGLRKKLNMSSDNRQSSIMENNHQTDQKHHPFITSKPTIITINAEHKINDNNNNDDISFDNNSNNSYSQFKINICKEITPNPYNLVEDKKNENDRHSSDTNNEDNEDDDFGDMETDIHLSEDHTSSDENRKPKPKQQTTPTSEGLNQRKHVVNELVKTQTDFAKDLNNIVIAFNSVSNNVSTADLYALLGNMENLATVSHEVAVQLREVVKIYSPEEAGNACVASCMLRFTQRLNQELGTYILNFEVDAASKNNRIQEFASAGIKALQLRNTSIVNLSAELIKPVQRLIKLKQLFELLKKTTPTTHPDHTATIQMCKNFSDLATSINETKRWKELCAKAFDDSAKNNLAEIIDCTTKRTLSKMARSASGNFNKKANPFQQERECISKLKKVCVETKDCLEQRAQKTRKILANGIIFVNKLHDLVSKHDGFKIHPDIPASENSHYLSLDRLDKYHNVLDSMMIHMESVYSMKLYGCVFVRLDELKKLLENSKKLFRTYDNTEYDIYDLDMAMKNQKNPQTVALLSEKRKEYVQIMKTLSAGLQFKIPQLIQHSKRILLAINALSLVIQSNLMKYGVYLMNTNFGNIFQEDTNNDNKNRELSFCKQIEMLRSNIYDLKSSPIRKTSEQVTLSKLEECIFEELSSNFRAIDRPKFSSTKIECGFRKMNSFNQSTLRSHANTADNRISRWVSDRSETNSLVFSNVATKSSSSLNVGSRKNVWDTRPNLSHCFKNNENSAATHAAAYDFESCFAAHLSIKKGDLLKLLQTEDASGNKEWSLVQSIQTNALGYVPSNYITPI